MKKMLPLIILGILLLALSLFLGVVHIIMLANVIGKDPIQVQQLADQPGLIGFLAGHLTFYGLLVVTPYPFVLGGGLFCVIFGTIRGKKLDKNNL